MAIAPILRRMKAKTEELLYFLLWNVHTLLRPTFRNLTASFEEWAYSEGFLHQLWELERQQLLERDGKADRALKGGAPLRYRLTEQGRVVALGGRDPVAAWNRSWDGQWRIVVFDLPETKGATRTRLRRFLRDHGFGYLQNSVWITPDRLGSLMTPWAADGQNVESLITFEARPCSGESNAAIVAGAWDFERINARYATCLAVLKQVPQQRPASHSAAGPLRRWARAERETWMEAVCDDPLLPRPLLPDGYLGERVWKQRQEVLGKAAGLIKA